MDVPPLARHSSLIKNDITWFDYDDTELIVEKYKKYDELHHAVIESCESETPGYTTSFISLKSSIETTGKEKS